MNVEQRLTKLERENRFLRLAGAACVVALASAFLMGAQKAKEAENIPDVLKAKKLVIVDAAGSERIVLAVEGGEFDTTGITVVSGGKKSRATLTAGAKGSALAMGAMGANTPRVLLTAGETQARLRSLQGSQVRFTAGIWEEACGVSLYDEEGNPYWSSPLDSGE